MTATPELSAALTQAVLDEIEAARRNGDLGDGYRTVAQCYVCCEIESNSLVNKLIAAMLTNREISEACASINSRRERENDLRLITARSVWNHRRNHYNVDEPAQAALREITERRAQAEGRDFINGIEHIVTTYGVMEAGMVKGMQQMMEPESRITPSETLNFAKTLHEFTSQDASQSKMADLMYTMDRLITAAQRFIPVDQHGAFIAAVEGKEPMAQLTEAVAQKAEKIIRDFSPPRTMDEEDIL